MSFSISGGHPLRGTVRCSGAKNSALKLLATTLLAPGRSTLHDVPDIVDIRWFVDTLRHLGADARWDEPGTITVDVPETLGVEAPYELVSRMRASTAVLGPLLAREGRARVALPGGCDLGPRGIDLHIRGLEKLGAEIHLDHGFLDARCDRLHGTTVSLDYPSHGATESLLMAGVLASGSTVIDNASREPEINDLADLLTAMGARISGAGTATIEIEGVDALRPATLHVMPDRLEAGTYLLAAVATGGDVTVDNAVPDHLEIVLTKIEEMGGDITVEDRSVRVRSEGRPTPTDVSTLPYPGFPTDLQPLAVAALSRADGVSIVTENIFDSRFTYTDELARLGADVRVEGHYAVVRGVSELQGAPVRAPDLRGGAALVVAALTAEGSTLVTDDVHIDRGYEGIEDKLGALGAQIERIDAGAPALA